MSQTWNVYENFLALQELPLHHIVIESFLVCLVIWLLVSARSATKGMKLSRKEEEQLLQEWTPEPLLPQKPDPNDPALHTRTVTGKIGHYVDVGTGPLLNMASFDFLSFNERKEIEEEALKALDCYGVGSCGPRLFFGTTEEHTLLEDEICKVYGTEDCVLYSYGFSTVASVIPCYSKTGDIIFVDERVSFAIQRGLQSSKSKIVYFTHNDPEHLGELLENQAKEDKKNPAQASTSRRFLVLEGLYINTGEICPLREMVSLRAQYKLRLFLDETCAYGTLGASGRGSLEHWGIEKSEVDLVIVSLEMAGGSSGGFCTGSKYVLGQQRLNGLGYVFSASLPPLQCAAIRKGCDILQKEGTDLAGNLQRNCKNLHKLLLEKLPKQVWVSGAPVSPIKHLGLALEGEGGGELGEDEQLAVLHDVVLQAETLGLCVVVASLARAKEHLPPPPSLRLTANTSLTGEEIGEAVDSLSAAFRYAIDKRM